MTFLLEQFPMILEFIGFAIIAKSLCEQSLLPSVQDIGMLLLVFVISFIPTSYPVALWVIGIIFYGIYIASACKGNLWEKLNLYFISYGSMVLLNFLTFAGISLFFSPDVWYMPIAGNTISILLAILLFRFTICKKLHRFLCQAKLPYKLLLTNTYFFLILLLFFYKINTNDFYLNLIYWSVIIFVLLMANICILYYDQKLFQQRQEIDSYEKNLPIYQSLIDEIRANQHEFSNRIQHFQKLPHVCKDYDSLSHALLKYSASYCKPLHNYALLQIDMPLLAATLYSFSCQADQNNITLTFQISTFHLSSSIPEYQLVDYVSILTQNAIEASKEGDRVYICISSDQNRFQFEIRNPSSRLLLPADIKRFFQKGYTSKENTNQALSSRHGYGLYSLRQNITRLGGMIGAECVEHSEKYWIIFRLEI